MAEPFFEVVSVKYGTGRRYVVKRDDKKVWGPGGHEGAYRNMERLKTEKPANQRPCLRCGTLIESEGPHHRLCGYCRTNVSELVAV